ncbi:MULTISPECIES: ABC transporter ATP-binding protein [Marinomonas]|uniref:ABC transporter ATP-binding protein n=1 Tax=Marinomonas rhodophyticola TaxID=2992803 RepID=A0ABT3KLY7_9GAMM|nr:ABC transporter ATP-binding protein [Marinomonas sp. KJ51-3]MCW4631022.1 ABC transporter ATP-binding protein [Marinomonas sp. KJ51-3]
MGRIIVKNVGKAYKQYPRKLSKVVEWIFPFLGKRHTLKWVLKDINFDIKPGEAVGIVGVNGAGKSTLLKMITGTTQPTTGSIEMQGRVAALLELGMGFHPEFTGRENAYMSGQLMGISKQEMDKLFPSIEEFAEIGDYIDMPVRVYSSGMQVRLAFSVATAIRPDILIVDEALSVGDVYFQHKSLERIKQYCKEGTTLLFVSHDTGAVRSICGTAILLELGTIAKVGLSEAVMDLYNAKLSSSGSSNVKQNLLSNGKTKTISGTDEASVFNIDLIDNNGSSRNNFNVGELIKIKISVAVKKEIEKLVLGFSFKDRLGQTVYGTNTYLLNQILYCVKPGSTYDFEFSIKLDIGVGEYSLQTSLGGGENHLSENYEWVDVAHTFQIIPEKNKSFVGFSKLYPELKVINK